jgi:GNAT superfamily N-acetyltransferase
MKYSRIDISQIDVLWELQKAYKAEIQEEPPADTDKENLKEAIRENRIIFYGAWDQDSLVGCCSITIGFSTFHYALSGVFEDFYICPQYRHKGIARKLVQFAFADSRIDSMTVGCADCDKQMYQALGFSVPLGNLLAYSPLAR